jgi:hypothetical protein
MRNNMLVNISGLPGHWMAIDLNIEHLIGYLKHLFASKGIYSHWDRLGNVSAAISHLQAIKKQVSLLVKAGYQRLNHTATDTSVLVWRIADKAQELNLHTNLTDRLENENAKPFTDLVVTGYKKFESSSLATFNKKIADSKVGILTIQEADDIVPATFTLISNENSFGEEDNRDDSDSILHDSEE